MGRDARIVYTAATTGTHQIEASGFGTYTGACELDAYADDLRNSPEGMARWPRAGVLNQSGDADILETTLVMGLTHTIEQRGVSTGDGTFRVLVSEGRGTPGPRPSPPVGRPMRSTAFW